jgi:hypothetical protein
MIGMEKVEGMVVEFDVDELTMIGCLEAGSVTMKDYTG